VLGAAACWWFWPASLCAHASRVGDRRALHVPTWPRRDRRPAVLVALVALVLRRTAGAVAWFARPERSARDPGFCLRLEFRSTRARRARPSTCPNTAAFAILAVLLYRRRPPEACDYASPWSLTGLAFVDEWVQWLVPERVGALGDRAPRRLCALVGLVFADVAQSGRLVWRPEAAGGGEATGGAGGLVCRRLHPGPCISATPW